MLKLFTFFNKFFRSKQGLTSVEEEKIITLIRQIESHSIGQVHVHLDSRVQLEKTKSVEDTTPNTNLVKLAGDYFTRVGLNQTKYRNGVLVYVWLKTHKLAIYGDVAAYEKLPKDFWQTIVQQSCQIIASKGLYSGLELCLNELNHALAHSFPKMSETVENEWPDGVSRS